MKSSGTGTALQSTETRRWPAVYAFVTCWLWPGTTARRMAHVSMGSAFAIHFGCILLALLVIAGLVGWIEDPDKPILDTTVEQIGQAYVEFQRAFSRTSFFFVSGVAIVVFVLELVFILLGLLQAPWGAGDERFRDSFRHAARLHWLSSPHWVIAILLCGLAAGPLAQANRNWYAANNSRFAFGITPMPARPTITLGANPTQAEQEAYDAAQQAYQQQLNASLRQQRELWDLWYAQRPWYVRYDEIILFWIVLPIAAWRLWGLFRIIAERPTPVVMSRPPTCETCGYDLTGATYWGKCPECGDAVERSLGETARCGPPWEHRRRLGRFIAWRQTAAMGLRAPEALGRLIRTGESRGHRHFLAIHLPLIAIVAAAGVFGINLVAFGRHRPGDALDIMALTTPGAGLGAAMATPLLAGLAAIVTGYWMARGARRNLMGAAARVTAYLCPVLLLWIGFAAVLGMVVMAYVPYLDQLARAMNLDDETLVAIVLVIPNLAVLLFYMSRLLRGVSAMRFANH